MLKQIARALSGLVIGTGSMLLIAVVGMVIMPFIPLFFAYECVKYQRFAWTVL